MLIWVCAMRCEAKPLIDYYRLKKWTDPATPFDIYQNGDVACIVGGIGEENIIRTLRLAAPTLTTTAANHWINLGIAGHKTLPVGSAVLISRTRNSQDSIAIEFSPPPEHTFLTEPLITATHEVSSYPHSAVVDMEAHAFAQHCLQSRLAVSCHCIKIISDNANTPPTRDKARISALIAAKMAHIADFARHLQENHHEAAL